MTTIHIHVKGAHVVVRGRARDEDFVEGDHPRDDDGKFKPKGGGAAVGTKAALGKLAKLPEDDDGFESGVAVKHLFEHEPTSIKNYVITPKEERKSLHVPHDKLVPTQHTVSKAHIERYLEKGVKITKSLTDHHLAQYLADRKKAAGKNGQLFSCNDAQVRDWFHNNGGEEFKVKDFRTWNGTCKALETITELPEPKTKAEYAKFRNQVGKQVAAHLGNTPTVALASYIDPAVFGRWSHLA